MAPDVRRGRRGATLVELLVVIAILAALAGLTLLLTPDPAQSNRVLNGTEQVQTTLRLSQAMAGTDKLPRGVRFISRGNNSPIVTELQLLEMRPVMLPNASPLTSGNPLTEPRVRFQYTEYDGVMVDPATNTVPPRGTIRSRVCELRNLTADQASQIGADCMLVLPALGTWAKIKGQVSSTPSPAPAVNQFDVVIDLEVYPDVHLGTNLAYLTYHFGIYTAPGPLLGEPTIPLPTDIGVDLSVSSPPGVLNQNLDIMFAPSGQLLTTGGQARNQVFLWVRDYTKVPSMAPISFSPLTYDPNQFRLGGEQQIVGIRSASIGTAPVKWPDMVTGQYQSPPPPGEPLQDPFTLARKQLGGP